MRLRGAAGAGGAAAAGAGAAATGLAAAAVARLPCVDDASLAEGDSQSRLAVVLAAAPRCWRGRY